MRVSDKLASPLQLVTRLSTAPLRNPHVHPFLWSLAWGLTHTLTGRTAGSEHLQRERLSSDRGCPSGGDLGLGRDSHPEQGGEGPRPALQHLWQKHPIILQTNDPPHCSH